jgi:hypothetical protein
MKRWSLDARSEGWFAYSLWGRWIIRIPSVDTRSERQSGHSLLKGDKRLQEDERASLKGEGKTRSVEASLEADTIDLSLTPNPLAVKDTRYNR